MPAFAQELEVPNTTRLSWLRFPVNWVVESPRLEGFIAKGVWLVVPLQYYVLTRFAGGFQYDAYVPSAILALACIVALFAVSCALALVVGGTGVSYQLRVRIWAITLIVSWAATLLLLALSYMVGLTLGLNADIVGHFLCEKMDCQAGYPTFQPPTFLSYIVYSSLALTLIMSAAHFVHVKTSSAERRMPLPGPNVFLVAIIVTILMTLLHGASTLPHQAPDAPSSGRIQ